MTTASCGLANTTRSPFGAQATLVQTLSAEVIAHKYLAKCGVDVLPFFGGVKAVGLYECARTGYRFWRPGTIAGTEAFYHLVSHAWENYYKPSRWEYPIARRSVHAQANVLEIGCGQGYFLKSLEQLDAHCTGLELNNQAIATKVTKYPIEHGKIKEFARTNAGRFDVVCSFQVLEHIVDPHSFLQAAVACLAAGGYLILSTPNHEYQPYIDQEDAFDLPPHHMGHFSAQTYQKVAPLIEMSLPQVHAESRSFAMPAAVEQNRNRTSFRLARIATKVIMNSTYRITHEPGPNVLVIYQKPA